VRKTYCSGRKHKDNVNDYYQKWMEEQAQSLIDKTMTSFQQEKLPPTPFSAPPLEGVMIPSSIQVLLPQV
jgi:U1 small nuclear ribonucleoprotein C